eukprot:s1646_g7.t1
MESIESSPRPRWIWKIYEQQALQTPDAAAVQCCPQGVTVTYRDVVENCDSLARQLWNSSGSRSPRAPVSGDGSASESLRKLVPLDLCFTQHGSAQCAAPARAESLAAENLGAGTGRCWATGLGQDVQLLSLDALAGAPPSPDVPDVDGAPELMALMCTGGSQRLKIVQVTHEMMISEQGA